MSKRCHHEFETKPDYLNDLICRKCETIWTITDYLELPSKMLKSLPKVVRDEVLKRQRNTVGLQYDNCFKMEVRHE